MPDMVAIEDLRIRDDQKVWWVMDPTEHSELGDIYFKADLRSIQLQAIGIKGLLPGLTLYMTEESAKREAGLRLKDMQS